MPNKNIIKLNNEMCSKNRNNFYKFLRVHIDDFIDALILKIKDFNDDFYNYKRKK